MADSATWRQVTKHPAIFAAFGFGSGLSPFMPGTAGTIAAVPLFWFMSHLNIVWYSAVVVLAFVVGIWFCAKASEQLGVHDHGGIVWDEFVGYWITMLAVPATALNMLAGFLLFRIFDIAKPWPISVLDKRIHGGLGIMIDDVLAGLFAAAVMQAGLYWFA